MKKLLIGLALLAFIGMSPVESHARDKMLSLCEHCTKDHKCDAKCKAGEKSACCKASGKAKKGKGKKKACCAKDATTVKSCQGTSSPKCCAKAKSE